jgi:putative transposase
MPRQPPLLEDLMGRGSCDPRRRSRFVIDGSRALPATISRGFGASSPVQGCRHHKIRNVCNQLPDDLADQVKAAYNLPGKRPWPSSGNGGLAGQLAGGLKETFTINRLKLPPSLRRCLRTTNIIEITMGSDSEPLVGWENGAAVGGGSLPGQRGELPPHLGYHDFGC